MQGTISTELLSKLFRATPEQMAAIELILECGGRSGECGVSRAGALGNGEKEFYQQPPHPGPLPLGGGEGGALAAHVVSHIEANSLQERTGEMGLLEAVLRVEQKVDGLVAAAGAPAKKEPLREAECLRVFRLFGELMAMGTELTAPPARVFDLMVFRKLTKAETAVECKCAASLITKRVATIEGHFGMPMERLCAFASDIKERQRTVKSDRYAKKKHGAVRDEREQYEDEGQPGLREDEHGYLPEERQTDEGFVKGS